MSNFLSKLMTIQQTLNAPKNLFNRHGGYSYRSCESILEAVKPLLKENGMVLTISDEVVNVGSKNYIKATARLIEVETGEVFTTAAFAREAETRKGMDDSQLTGATSSYARKYALNGLFAIDDNKDADATNTHGKEASAAFAQPAVNQSVVSQERLEQIELGFSNCNTNSEYQMFWASLDASEQSNEKVLQMAQATANRTYDK